MKCPDCGFSMIVAHTSYILHPNKVREDIAPHAYCFNKQCHSVQRGYLGQFTAYSRMIALIIPETEVDPDRCGGEPVFTESRLPVSVILAQIELGENDADIMQGYPRMTPFLLGICRKVLADNPPPPTPSVIKDFG